MSVPASSRGPHVSRRARSWIGALLLLLLGSEFIARHYIAGPLNLVRPSEDPELLYELRPGHYVSDGYFLRSPVVEYTVDERGCRQREDGAAPDPGTPVYFLGSSMVFGIAVDADTALPEVARRALRALDPPVAIAPANCSVPGYSLLQTLHHAELAIERDGVRTIALLIGPKHGSVPYDWTRTAPASPAFRWLTERVRLARLVHLARIVSESDGFRLPPAPRDELRAALDRFAEVVRRTGTRVTVFPIGRFEHPDFDLRVELESRGFATVPIEPPPHDPAHVHSDGDHYNLAGVTFLVDAMTPALVSLAADHGASTR